MHYVSILNMVMAIIRWFVTDGKIMIVCKHVHVSERDTVSVLLSFRNLDYPDFSSWKRYSLVVRIMERPKDKNWIYYDSDTCFNQYADQPRTAYQTRWILNLFIRYIQYRMKKIDIVTDHTGG